MGAPDSLAASGHAPDVAEYEVIEFPNVYSGHGFGPLWVSSITFAPFGMHLWVMSSDLPSFSVQ
jgi:hypothetical protein